MADLKVALIGFTGVGKTETGMALAQLIAADFYDIDREIEKEAGMSVTDLLAKEGIERFRDRETRALDSLLARPGRAVIATGGGTLMRPANRARLKEASRVLWLRAQPATIWERVQSKPYVAPLFYTNRDPLVAIRSELVRREPHYGAAADVTLDIDGRTPQDTAHQAAASLKTINVLD